MQISEYGVRLIASFEGWSAKPYPDPASGGIPYTIGFGSTTYPNGKAVTMQDPEITKEQGYGYLKWEVEKKCIPAIERWVKAPLSQGGVDSLCSFIYNVGAGNFSTSTLVRKINIKASCGEIQGEFGRWVRASGKVLPGLVKRRQAEAKLFCKS